jgi:hypothetical protein
MGKFERIEIADCHNRGAGRSTGRARVCSETLCSAQRRTNNSSNRRKRTMKSLQQLLPHVVNDTADHIAQFETEEKGNFGSNISAALTTYGTTDAWYRPITATIRFPCSDGPTNRSESSLYHQSEALNEVPTVTCFGELGSCQSSREEGSEMRPRTPLMPRPGAKKLLLDGVGAGNMEREATKSRCSSAKRGKDKISLPVD